MADLVPTCVWRTTPELVVALDDRFGEPVDAYVNGSQVWLRDDGPGGTALEWRLHPVAGFERPATVTTYDLFPSVALAIAQGEEPVAPPEALWEIRPVEPPTPPYRAIGYDVIVTGDRPPQAARATDLGQACRKAVRRYLRHRAPAESSTLHTGARP